MVIILFGFVMVGAAILVYYQDIDGIYVHRPLTLRMDTTNIETDKSVYKAGDTVYVHMSFCKNYEYTSSTAWNLVNSIIRPYPAKSYRVPMGCTNGLIWFPIVQIPTDTAFLGLSQYHLEGSTVIEVNRLNHVVYNFKTVNFTIKPNVK